jgi:ABC-type uncharacterized transport system permease subunit
MRRSLTFIILTACILLLTNISLSVAVDDLECNKNVARTAVHAAATGLGEVLKNITNEQGKINVIRSFIDPIRFYPDRSGYFYV